MHTDMPGKVIDHLQSHYVYAAYFFAAVVQIRLHWNPWWKKWLTGKT